MDDETVEAFKLELDEDDLVDEAMFSKKISPERSLAEADSKDDFEDLRLTIDESQIRNCDSETKLNEFWTILSDRMDNLVNSPISDKKKKLHFEQLMTLLDLIPKKKQQLQEKKSEASEAVSDLDVILKCESEAELNDLVDFLTEEFKKILELPISEEEKKQRFARYTQMLDIIPLRIKEIRDRRQEEERLEASRSLKSKNTDESGRVIDEKLIKECDSLDALASIQETITARIEELLSSGKKPTDKATKQEVSRLMELFETLPAARKRIADLEASKRKAKVLPKVPDRVESRCATKSSSSEEKKGLSSISDLFINRVLIVRYEICIFFYLHKMKPTALQVKQIQSKLATHMTDLLELESVRLSVLVKNADGTLYHTEFLRKNDVITFKSSKESFVDTLLGLDWQDDALHFLLCAHQGKYVNPIQVEIDENEERKRKYEPKAIKVFNWILGRATNLSIRDLGKCQFIEKSESIFDSFLITKTTNSEFSLHKRRELLNFSRHRVNNQDEYKRYEDLRKCGFNENFEKTKEAVSGVYKNGRNQMKYEGNFIQPLGQTTVFELFTKKIAFSFAKFLSNEKHLRWLEVLDKADTANMLMNISKIAHSYVEQFNRVQTENQIGAFIKEYIKFKDLEICINPTNHKLELAQLKPFPKSLETLLEAFTHYTYQESKKQLIVVVLNAYEDTLSSTFPCHILDCVIFSRKREFGSADLGEKGIRNFFDNHKCENLCRKMALEI